MKYRVWYSTESFADFIIANTDLRNKGVVQTNKMYESDANNSRNFHTMPDHIKKILYLDAPDIIVELDSEPIFSIEVSTEAGTGHNVFQRFARLAASVENNVPSFYIYPEAAIIHRKKGSTTKWDEINPLIFKALEHVMSIYNIPSLFYYFPSDFKDYRANPSSSPNLRYKGLIYDSNRNYAGSPKASDSEMQKLFEGINEIILINERHGVVKGRGKLLGNRTLIERKDFMQQEYANKSGHLKMSPLSATHEIPTEYILNYLKQFESTNYKVGELLKSRNKSILYQVDSKTFRSDPYSGCIAAIDYLKCREGRTFEERRYNLIAIWGTLEVDNTNKTIKINTKKKSSIKSLVDSVKNSEARNILKKNYSQLKNYEIPRYYMQMRYGSTFSKPKEVRIFAYFADAILFPDGALWRDA
jgi:hypothetical protein